MTSEGANPSSTFPVSFQAAQLAFPLLPNSTQQNPETWEMIQRGAPMSTSLLQVQHTTSMMVILVIGEILDP